MIDRPGEGPIAREAPITARAGVRIASTELFRGRREIVLTQLAVVLPIAAPFAYSRRRARRA